LGVLIGQQYMNPNKRVLPVIAAVVVIGLAWRLDLVTSIGVLLFLLPYPKGTAFGTTNLMLSLIIGILWLVNASMRRAAPPRRTPVDGPLAGLVILYLCSFYNIHDPEVFAAAMRNTEVFLGSVLGYYIVVSNVNTTNALQRVHLFQVVSAVSVYLFAIYELRHPGAILAGGWIQLTGSTHVGAGESFSRRNVRVGSTFGDYELLSEFSVMCILLGIFLLARARTQAQRLAYTGFLLLSVFIMFTTVTRGAIVSLGVGLAVMLWTTRRRVKFVPLVIGVAVTAALVLGMNFYVSHFTTSGDLFARLSETTFQNGVPDSRIGAWVPALERAMKHPWIGQGPYYAPMFGFGFVWPHNVYLFYANIVGFVGLGFFLLVLVALARATRPDVDSLRHPDYARAYLVVAQAQFVAFVVNEFKIDYIRNSIYQTVVWAMFSVWVAAHFIARNPAARAASTVSAVVPPAPLPRATPVAAAR
ncbi:MAG TPA: O-antigen ligase family protein, partial [Dongiaceae bacterium]|nr:O-antigen ligase family protein [Dongiaceae bacterium]